MSKRVLVLAAHPDDAELFAGGTLAKMIADGAEVAVLVATNGDAGSFELGRTRLAEVRRLEALQAAGVLGVHEVAFLDHPDGELDRLEPGFLRAQFIRAIRERRPDVVFTFDPFAPFEDHPDHRAVAFAALEAAHFSAFPLYCPEQLAEGLETHLVAERYFFAKHPTHANEAVDISDTLEIKIAALLQHKSQVAFLFEFWVRQAALAGVEISTLLPDEIAADERAAQGLAWVVRQQARAAGAAAGMEFAERFRHARFTEMVEAVLGAQGS